MVNLRFWEKSPERIEKDSLKRLHIDSAMNPIIARTKEAVEDSSLLIYDRNAKLEERAIQLFTLLNTRMTDMQARDDPVMAGLFDVAQEIQGKEWDRTASLLEWIDEQALLSGKSDMRLHAKTVRRLATDYFGEWVVPAILSIFAVTFPKEQAAVQYVATVQQMMANPGGGTVQVISKSEEMS
ncbi:MAG: hypothetical protein KGO96_13080 [Elusimicrobia bacterium]|nr:hypothetical protein [Elusimicrobiota bacterium]MDE2426827.1 hypothetical protein [Elusimicrobiota bacterium]